MSVEAEVCNFSTPKSFVSCVFNIHGSLSIMMPAHIITALISCFTVKHIMTSHIPRLGPMCRLTSEIANRSHTERDIAYGVNIVRTLINIVFAGRTTKEVDRRMMFI